MTDKLAIGIAAYGTQQQHWWSSLATMTATLHTYDIALTNIYIAGSMNTDRNRNTIADAFMQGKADWLLWIDTDNTIPLGGVRRLLDTQKEIVGGLYYQKAKPYLPVAYTRNPNGRYSNIKDWNRGELLPVDAIGMGATLTHRCVYEAIKDNYRVFQRWTGGITTIHKDEFSGILRTEFPSDPKPRVKGSQYREWLIIPTTEEQYFPYFMLEFGRTEDMWFYETAIRVGYKPYVDTSVECQHITEKVVCGDTYREYLIETETSQVVMTEYNLETE